MEAVIDLACRCRVPDAIYEREGWEPQECPQQATQEDGWCDDCRPPKGCVWQQSEAIRAGIR